MRIDELFPLKEKKNGDQSPLTYPGTKKWRKKAKNAQPGTDEWFRTWFSRPFLTNKKS